MMTEPFVSETEIRVRYGETDAMGIVNNAVYISYFEEGRSDFSRQASASYADLEAAGYVLVVSEIEARYHASAKYDQMLIIRTHVDRLRTRGVTWAYEIVLAETGQRLVTGKSHHICLDSSGTPARIPDYWYEAMAKLDGNSG